MLTPVPYEDMGEISANSAPDPKSTIARNLSVTIQAITSLTEDRKQHTEITNAKRDTDSLFAFAICMLSLVSDIITCIVPDTFLALVDFESGAKLALVSPYT